MSTTGMTLTPAERSAARVFRAARRAELAAVPADITVSVFARCVRHGCARQGGKSVFLELREQYVLSPAFQACDCGQVCCRAVPRLVECDGCGPALLVPAGRFGWVWTRGRCGCGLSARSSSGRLVDPAVRPPAGRSAAGG